MDTKRKGFANSSPRENMNFRKDCWHNTKLFFKEVWVIVIDIYQKLNRKLESSLYIIILKIKLLVCYAVWTVTCSARLIFWHLLILRVDSEQLSISIHLFSGCLLVNTVLFQNEKTAFLKMIQKMPSQNAFFQN